MALVTETTDAAADRSTTYRMSAGDKFRGTALTGESDWVAITLQAGQVYSFAATATGALGQGLVDPRLVLMGADGQAILGDDDSGPGLFARFTYVPTQGGTFYLQVSSDRSGSLGSYALSVTAGILASYGPESGAAALLRDEVSWAETVATPATVTWGFRDTGPGIDASGDVVQFLQLSTLQREAVHKVLANYSEVANLTFTQVAPEGTTNDATILVGRYSSATDGAGAYAWYPGSRASGSEDGDVWLNSVSVSSINLQPGTYSWYAVMHEFGHALGLAHPGDYNAAPGVQVTYAQHAQFREDSAQFTVMSYFAATATQPNAPSAKRPDTLMMYDILALQKLYGVNAAAHAGPSVYGFNATEGGVYNFATNRKPLLCIWDGSGIDTIDVSGFSMSQRISLADGGFSDIGGYRGNVSIAVGCKIENAVGGSGADQIFGNGMANQLRGGPGDDTIAGLTGNDKLIGGYGADTFVFGKGDGIDRVLDFDIALDRILLSPRLLNGAILSAAEVVAAYAGLRNGHVVLDFGSDELHLDNLMGLSGLDGQLSVDYA